MKIELDIKPLSINVCWQGRRFKTQEYKDWREEFGWLVKKIKPFKADMYVIEIDWWSPNVNRADIDNPIKPILDALTENKIIIDDRRISDLHIKKHKGDYKIIIKIDEST